MTPIFDEIRAKDLTEWADRAESERLMPSLMQQLIFASGADIRSCRFLSHEQTNLSGWDGVGEAANAGTYVPEGLSGWELSLRKDVVAKADEDIQSRSESPGELVPPDTTYVAVTLRLWPGKVKDGNRQDGNQHKTEWARERRERYGWKEVLVLDAADLHAWLLKCPGVALWLAQVMGRQVAGARSLVLHWSELAGLRAGVAPGVFLAGRDHFTAALNAWLGGEPSVFEAHSWSSEDLRDSIAAWWSERLSSGGPLQLSPISVNSGDAWGRLAKSTSKLILLADDGLELTSEQATAAASAGHFVIRRVQAGRGRSAGAALLPLQRDILADQLRLSGFDNAEAWRTATDVRGSGVALKRVLSGTGPEPAWAQEGSVLAPLILIGAWDAGIAADRERVASVFRKPYNEVEAILDPWRKTNEPLVVRKNNVWRVVAREEAWRWLCAWLRKEDFERFAAAATEVLSELDPRYDLPAEERFYANLKNAVPAHSRTLHKAMAESLCLLALRTEQTESADVARSTARRVVTGVFSNAADWRLWASLEYSLTYIAESAPDVFLEALEADLSKNAPVTAELLKPVGNGFTEEHYHTNLMWALESLLWEKTTVLRALLVLARIALLDPGDNMNPRPAGVLRQALLPWYPQCCLNVGERCAALDRLVEVVPDAAWNLLPGMLGGGQDSSSETHRPKFRGRSSVHSHQVTHADYWQQVEHTARLAVKCAGTNSGRWRKLISRLSRMSEETFNLALQSLTDATRHMEDAEREEVWETLREETSSHRYFVTAKWSMDGERRSRLEAMTHAIAPACPVRRNAWLFSSNQRFLPGITTETPAAERDQLIESAQAEALREIMSHSGLEGIQKLLTQPGMHRPYEAGRRAALHGIIRDADFSLREWLESSHDAAVDFACGFASGRFHTERWKWIEALNASEWSPVTFGLFAMFLPCGEDTWWRVKNLGPAFSDAYWRRTRVWTDELTGTQPEHAVVELLRVGRPVAALELVDNPYLSHFQFGNGILFDVLEAMLARAIEMSTAGEAGESMELYHLTNAFEQLQHRENLTSIELEKLEQLEWAFLPVLKAMGSPRLLLRRLWTQPEFFVELLEATSWPDSLAPHERSVLTDEQKNHAELCGMLFDCTKGLPGNRTDGPFDQSALGAWLAEARRLSAEKDRTKACDRRLGRLFLYSPVDDSGCWPCAAVCEQLENGSTEIRECFSAAIYNNQGWPGLQGDTGMMSSLDQHGKAITLLKDYAAKLELRFPVTAELLQKCAQQRQHFLDSYDRDE